MANFPVLQVTEGEWRSGKFYDILGVKVPAEFMPDPQLFSDFISNFQTRPDDIFIVTYPKSGELARFKCRANIPRVIEATAVGSSWKQSCLNFAGTTWIQEVTWQIFNNGEVKSSHILERVPFLEVGTSPIWGGKDFTSIPSPRLLKTHLTYDATPKSTSDDTKCKYIYVARNPKDAAVSYFHFENGLKSATGYNGPWEFYAKLFVEGNVGWNHWSDHVLGWWKHKDDPNVLFLKYEDLRKDLLSHVRLIANFVNKPLSEDTICRIAEQCSFSGMVKNPSSYLIPSEDGKKISILRKGVVGDWKNYFTPDLSERFEKEVLAKLEGSGLEFEFEM